MPTQLPQFPQIWKKPTVPFQGPRYHMFAMMFNEQMSSILNDSHSKFLKIWKPRLAYAFPTLPLTLVFSPRFTFLWSSFLKKGNVCPLLVLLCHVCTASSGGFSLNFSCLVFMFIMIDCGDCSSYIATVVYRKTSIPSLVLVGGKSAPMAK